VTAPARCWSGPECGCGVCRSACERFPGWMSPGDVRLLAAMLEQPPAALFDTHLAFDRWFGGYELGGLRDDSTVWVVLPAAASLPPGELFPRGFSDAERMGCTFYDRPTGACAIHAIKPVECREAVICDRSRERGGGREFRIYIARAWGRPAGRRFMAELRTAVVRRRGHTPFSWSYS